MPSWTATHIEYELTVTGYIVRLFTDVPCHLWLYYSPYEPWVHKVSFMYRGELTMQPGYWCFVLKSAIDQSDPGDTLLHTYIWDGWYGCLTQWFFFHGTIAFVTSLSQSPIFHLHYPYSGIFRTSKSDAYLLCSGAIPYPAVRNSPSATSLDYSGTAFIVGQRKTGVTYFIWRSLLYFDLRDFEPLPRVSAAILRLYTRYNDTPVDFSVTVIPGSGISDPCILTDYGLLPPIFINYGDWSTVGQPEGFHFGPCFIHLNEAGIDYCQQNPILKLALVSSRDISSTPPDSSEFCRFWTHDHDDLTAATLHLFYHK